MWLINVTTLELEYFQTAPMRGYAILSHTWETEEVSFDFWNTRDHGEHLKGFKKIKRFRQVTRDTYGLEYAWVDTCCIDKTSSAELSEAINSMYRWYRESKVCVAYLADVGNNASNSEICRSRWFTRGWTLQEFLAPREVRFYDTDWEHIITFYRWEPPNANSRPKTALDRAICKRTKIPDSVLHGASEVHQWNIATRMSWAASRKTTRAEDQAYSLLGLFDINMPLLYGEGRKAFVRLQEEILRTTTDQSIFAFQVPDIDSIAELPGILANTPEAFTGVGNREVITLGSQDAVGSQVIDITNTGIGMTLPLMKCGAHEHVYHLVLNCCFRSPDYGHIALTLRDQGGQTFTVDNVDDKTQACSAFHMRRLAVTFLGKDDATRTVTIIRNRGDQSDDFKISELSRLPTRGGLKFLTSNWHNSNGGSMWERPSAFFGNWLSDGMRFPAIWSTDEEFGGVGFSGWANFALLFRRPIFVLGSSSQGHSRLNGVAMIEIGENLGEGEFPPGDTTGPYDLKQLIPNLDQYMSSDNPQTWTIFGFEFTMSVVEQADESTLDATMTMTFAHPRSVSQNARPVRRVKTFALWERACGHPGYDL